MKTIKIILLTIGLTIFGNLNAQETIVQLKGFLPPNANHGPLYLKDTTNTFDKYFGTWVYDDGTNYLMITFSKKSHVRVLGTDHFRDQLACEFLFKINGVEQYNTYGANSEIDSYTANGILGNGILGENKVYLGYHEPPLNNSCGRYKSGNLTLEYVDDLPQPKLIWTREYDQMFGDNNTCGDGSIMDMSDFLIPANMVLIKQ